MKTIGILGGMGPASSAYLYQRIVALTHADRDQDHARILIYSNPKVANRIEAILSGRTEVVLADLQESARVLERGGADFLIIACNTAHFWLEGIRAAVTIPVLDMIGETAAHLRDRRVPRAGLLCSLGTLHSGLYQKGFAASGVELVYPDPDLQGVISGMIDELKRGSPPERLRPRLRQARAWFAGHGITTVILGCSEISMISGCREAGCTDSIEIISEIAVRAAGGTLVAPHAPTADLAPEVRAHG